MTNQTRLREQAVAIGKTERRLVPIDLLGPVPGLTDETTLWVDVGGQDEHAWLSAVIGMEAQGAKSVLSVGASTCRNISSMPEEWRDAWSAIGSDERLMEVIKGGSLADQWEPALPIRPDAVDGLRVWRVDLTPWRDLDWVELVVPESAVERVNP